ncbi:MAG: hypothetical protein VCC00_15220 [Deltaproteobacteria bacterium]
MLNSSQNQSGDAYMIHRELLDLPEERALQLVVEGLCVVVPPESGMAGAMTLPDPAVRKPRP